MGVTSKKIKHICNKIVPSAVTKYQFQKKLGYKLNLKEPQTLNEKIQYLKLYEYANNKLISQCADKLAVREYVKEKLGGQELLINLIGNWESSEEINFDNLPDKFVMKCTHGSGFNVICKNKKDLDWDSTKQKINQWMNTDFSLGFAEMQYKNIPHRIIAEEYLEEDICDYKIFCFNGKPHFMYISQGSAVDETLKVAFFDMEGHKCPFERSDEKFFDVLPSIPEKFEEMKCIAAKLSEDFKFVRVDLYEVNHKIYFSELTFTPAAGMMPFVPSKWDRIWGDKLSL